MGRRSKSRDSQFSDSGYGRHKIEASLTARNAHRSKLHQKFDGDYLQDVSVKKQEPKLDLNNKKTATMSRCKKKESPKMEEITSSTFPRKGTLRAQSLFENDFVPSETDSPVSTHNNSRFTFEQDFETSEAESPVIVKPTAKMRQNSKLTAVRRGFESDFSKEIRATKMGFRERKLSPRFQTTQKSLFEDDFSPTEKPLEEDKGISSIKEESGQNEADDSFGENNFDKVVARKKMLSKARFSNGQLKKSESVNIFARENDPFDDEFFSGQESTQSRDSKSSPKNPELKWTEEFDDFDIHDRK